MKPSKRYDIIAMVAAAVTVTACGGPSRPDGPDRAVDKAIVLSNAVPVLAADGKIEFSRESMAQFENVTSIGTAASSGIVATSGSIVDGEVHLIDTNGDVLAHYDGVEGIALTDPAGDTAAWVARSASNGQRQVVIASTETGELFGAAELAGELQVTAIHEGTVAVSDGYRSSIWSPSDGMEDLTYVPQGDLVVGLTDSRVVTVDRDWTTKIFDRGTGQVVGSLAQFLTWDVSATAGKAVGATEDGTAKVVNLNDGSATPFQSPWAVGTAAFGEDGSVVLWNLQQPHDDADGVSMAVCGAAGSCQAIVSNGVPYTSNSGLGQIGAQSS